MPIKKNLENPKINIRIKLSGLWVSVMFCYIYGDYFELYVPKKVEGLISGANMLDSPAKLAAASFLLALPACMIFLSLALKPGWCRIVNIVFGLFYTLLMLFIGLNSITAWLGYYVFFAFLEVVLTSLVVFYAWKWPDAIH